MLAVPFGGTVALAELTISMTGVRLVIHVHVAKESNGVFTLVGEPIKVLHEAEAFTNHSVRSAIRLIFVDMAPDFGIFSR